ncbi:MAG: hypothetical protein IKO57_08890 [Treponema sp.]|nr:hypothetical protein [Treponema sp.]MBR6914633.1 hypothetical protein [Treponema sp.]
MKKSVFMLAAFAAVSLFSLFSCTDDDEEPYTEFKDYAAFSENKAAWSEPSSYSFSYVYDLGLSGSQKPVTVTVTNGEAAFDCDDSAALESYTKFDSISRIYEFFDLEWQSAKAEENKNLGITFYATFETADNGKIYPKKLSEKIDWLGNGDAPSGVGGEMSIAVSGFKIAE